MANSLKNTLAILFTGATYALTRMNQDSPTTQVFTLPEFENNEASTNRRLLQNEEVRVLRRPQDQIVELSKPYAIENLRVFEGNYSMTLLTNLPDGFQSDYKLLGSYPMKGATNIQIHKGIAHVLNDNLLSLDVRDVRNIRPLSNQELDSPGTSMAVKGQMVFLFSPKVFRIMDFSNPNYPKELSNYTMDADLSNSNTAITVSQEEDLAFLKGPGRIEILNISQPTEPQKLSEHFFPSTGNLNVGGLAYYPPVLYSLNLYGLDLIDISNPSNPEYLFTHQKTGCLSITIEDNQAYIPCGYQGLDILDLSNPRVPYNRNGYIPEARYYMLNVAKMGNKLFIAGTNPAAWEVVDISGNIPTLVATHWSNDFQSRILGFTAHYVFVSEPNELKIYDLQEPILRGKVHPDDVFEPENAIFLHALDAEGRILKTTQFNILIQDPPEPIQSSLPELRVSPSKPFALTFKVENEYRTSDPHAVTLSLASLNKAEPLPSWLTLNQEIKFVSSIPRNNPGTGPDHLLLNPPVALVSYDQDEIQVLALNNLEHPQEYSKIKNTSGDLSEIGSLLFTSDGNKLSKIDVFSLLKPEFIGSYPQNFYQIQAYSKYLFALNSQGVQVFELDGNYNLNQTQTIPSGKGCMHVADEGFYLANRSGIYTGLMTNASQISIQGHYPVYIQPNKVFLQGKILYLADQWSEKLISFDVSDPLNPKPLNYYVSGAISDLDVDKNRIYLATKEGVQILDAKNPENLRLIAFYKAKANAVKSYSPHTFAIIDEDKGFELLNISSEWTLKAAPKAEDAGNKQFILKATSSEGAASTRIINLRIDGTPQVSKGFPNQLDALVDQELHYSVVQAFDHPNGDLLTYQIVINNLSLSQWLKVDPSTGTLWGMPHANQTGLYNFELKARDPAGNSASITLNLLVKANNATPEHSSDFSKPFFYAGLAMFLAVMTYATCKNRAPIWNSLPGKKKQVCSIDLSNAAPIPFNSSQENRGSYQVRVLTKNNNNPGFFDRRNPCSERYNSNYGPNLSPHWLKIDEVNKAFELEAVPENIKKVFIQFKDPAGYIIEQLELNIKQPKDESELSILPGRQTNKYAQVSVSV